MPKKYAVWVKLVRLLVAMRALDWVRGITGCGLMMAAVAAVAGCHAAANAAQQPAAAAASDGSVSSEHAKSLIDTHYRFRAAIYHAHAPKQDVRAVVKRLAGEQFALVDDEDAAEKSPRATVAVSAPPIADFSVPKKESLKYFSVGLSSQDEDALLASQSVSLFSFRGPGEQASAQYRAALRVMAALVRELGGYAWDEESRRAYSAQSFQGLLEHWQGNEPRIADHVVLHMYRDGELIRIVSLGMVKFGLPDLAINQVSSKDEAMGAIANLVCQTLLERGKLGSEGQLALSIDDLKHAGFKAELMERANDNAKRQVALRLVGSLPREGDADNRLLEIAFPGSASSLQEKQAAAGYELFGGHDSIVRVKHDQALLAASARARKKALSIGKRYAKGPPFGEQLLVKAPFETSDGGNEWMWVEVVSWNGDKIDGILQNDPFDVPTLKSGSRVAVKASEIFDYLLTKSDGSREGNETSALLEAREKAGAEVRKK